MTYECRIPLKVGVVVVGQSPCEKAMCASFNLCKTQLLACTSFQRWVNTGRALYPTIPDKETYNRIFGDDDIPKGGRIAGSKNYPKTHKDMIE